MCSTPSVPPPTPPPQLAKTPDAGTVRASTAQTAFSTAAQTQLSGGGGSPILPEQLSKKDILG